MKKLLFMVLLLISSGLSAATALQWAVSAEEWSRPRNAERILSLQPVSESVRVWMESPGYRLVIKYPGGEEGALWGAELRDWLISLGVPSSEIKAVPGHVRNDELIIVLRRQGDV